MTAVNRRRVVLLGGGDETAPGELVRALLDRGHDVFFTRAAPAAVAFGSGPCATIVVGRFGGERPSELPPDVTLVNVDAFATGPVLESIDHVGPKPAADARTWKPWFPVIDYSRCTNCMQCLSFCLFDVYGVSAERRIQVQNQSNCKTDCPACSRVCPEVAIMFPKYRHGPINGDEVSADDVRREAMKVDISALLGGDVYSMLRDRSAKAKSRFSKERDDERALRERHTCLVTLQRELDVPPELLAALPTPDEIRAKAEAAAERARQATGEPAGS